MVTLLEFVSRLKRYKTTLYNEFHQQSPARQEHFIRQNKRHHRRVLLYSSFQLNTRYTIGFYH